MDSDDKDQASAHERIGVLFKSGERQEFAVSAGALARTIQSAKRIGFHGLASNEDTLINLEEVAAIYRVDPSPVREELFWPLPLNRMPTPVQIKRARRHLGLSEVDWMHAEITPGGTLIARAVFGDFQIIPDDRPIEGDQG
ncbi:hypothetical protein SAMN05444389_101419 [Paracoccus solventivorans]|uniref:Uncharacterized protein n=1 Tax=Paracoccus solventivorans TaxID=53463 RepID=A0A1M7DL88_9RHOB|nr:hypothetical protein [Paracoccus solventivorans]SHL80123.1 hypothetical protein SAMN05444389_101419 [Paracoccus solventivorans]